MELQVIPLDFLGQGAMLSPADPALFKLAMEFSRNHLAQEPNLSKLAKSWVSARVLKSGTIDRIVGICGTVLRPDIPLFRAIEMGAVKSMKDRINDYYADQGFRGGEAFIYISDTEPEESRCPRYKEFLEAFGAVPAERYIVKCK